MRVAFSPSIIVSESCSKFFEMRMSQDDSVVLVEDVLPMDLGISFHSGTEVDLVIDVQGIIH